MKDNEETEAAKDVELPEADKDEKIAVAVEVAKEIKDAVVDKDVNMADDVEETVVAAEVPVETQPDLLLLFLFISDCSVVNGRYSTVHEISVCKIIDLGSKVQPCPLEEFKLKEISVNLTS